MRTEGWQRDRFRELLKQIRDLTGLGDKEIAALTGRSRSQANRWNRAENQPDFEGVRRLVDGLEQYGPDVKRLGAQLLGAAGYEPIIQVSQQEPGPADTPTSFVDAMMRAEQLFDDALARDDVPREELEKARRRLREVEERILARLLDRDEARAEQPTQRHSSETGS